VTEENCVTQGVERVARLRLSRQRAAPARCAVLKQPIPFCTWRWAGGCRRLSSPGSGRKLPRFLEGKPSNDRGLPPSAARGLLHRNPGVSSTNLQRAVEVPLRGASSSTDHEDGGADHPCLPLRPCVLTDATPVQ
jgi:hypothetical protein